MANKIYKMVKQQINYSFDSTYHVFDPIDLKPPSTTQKWILHSFALHDEIKPLTSITQLVAHTVWILEDLDTDDNNFLGGK